MKTEIANGEHLLYEMEMANLKPGESLQSLCVELFNHGFETEENVMIVKISSTLVGSSYLANPAMFSRTFGERNPYPFIQSYLRDGFLIVRAAKKKKEVTFRGQVREKLEEGKEFTTRKSLVPKSYRRRPSILSSALSYDMGQTVCNDCIKEDYIRWYLKE